MTPEFVTLYRSRILVNSHKVPCTWQNTDVLVFIFSSRAKDGKDCTLVFFYEFNPQFKS